MVKFKGYSMRLNLVRKVDDSYSVTFGYNMIRKIAKELHDWRADVPYAIITDSNVYTVYGRCLEQFMKRHCLDTRSFVFEAGERSKTEETAVNIGNGMLHEKLGRETVIIALGGGVVGDLAGVVAANYLRGVDYVQIPTTLLAQADSSIGGKTAVDMKEAKNAWGAFKQPKRVFVDVKFLETLDDEQFGCGIPEITKHGVIRDREFFEYLESNLDEIMERSPETMIYVATQNCRIKGDVVEQDPDEKGLRRILNYGHTVGHVIETLSGYTMPHGRCLAIGMNVAGRLANNLTGFPESDLLRQNELLAMAGLPTKIPKTFSNNDIIKMTTRDKKAKCGVARFCLPTVIGKMAEFDGQYATYVDECNLRKALDASR